MQDDSTRRATNSGCFKVHPRSVGVSECRSVGVPECRSAGVPECRSVPPFRLKAIPVTPSSGDATGSAMVGEQPETNRGTSKGAVGADSLHYPSIPYGSALGSGGNTSLHSPNASFDVIPGVPCRWPGPDEVTPTPPQGPSGRCSGVSSCWGERAFSIVGCHRCVRYVAGPQRRVPRLGSWSWVERGLRLGGTDVVLLEQLRRADHPPDDDCLGFVLAGY